MTLLKLPYPGFSWSMTQHIGPATQQEAMYTLLQAAHIFRDDPTYQNRITEFLIQQKLLTPDVRRDAGRPQLWRDYQQVLPELGLIVSTRFTDRIVITPAGLMWLDGIIGYSELVTTQCLRYQYPNGHKQDISYALKNALDSSKISVPETRTELDANFGVLIKPAVLILRILLQLVESGDSNPRLEPRECLAALVPVRKNKDWQVGLNELTNIRKNGLPNVDSRGLRHIQEWFRLLSVSDIFDLSRTGLGLTPVATKNFRMLRDFCAYHEDPATFWVAPTGNRRDIAWSWFSYYGNPDIQSQWLIPEDQKDLGYLEENYPGGVEEPEEWEETGKTFEWSSGINLQPFKEKIPSALPRPGKIDAKRMARGQLKRQRSTRLHREIVSLLASRLQSIGYTVTEDPSSVDLLALKPQSEAIVEVKTVTPRTLSNRIRLGVGQLLEYRYRRQIQEASKPTGVLVISSAYSFPDWFVKYFETDIELGLVSRTSSDKLSAHTSGDFERLLVS